METFKIPFLFMTLYLINVAFPKQTFNKVLQGGNKRNAGIRARLDSYGLNYLNEMVAKVLIEEFKAAKIPDIQQTSSMGNIQAKNIEINTLEFGSSEVMTRYPNSVIWAINDVKLGATADLGGHVVYILPFALGGQLTANGIVDCQITNAIDLERDNKPLVKCTDCQVNIKHMDMQIHNGGTTGLMANTFKGIAIGMVKPFLETQLCSVIKTAIDKELNNKLQQFPTKIALSEAENMDMTGLLAGFNGKWKKRVKNKEQEECEKDNDKHSNIKRNRGHRNRNKRKNSHRKNTSRIRVKRQTRWRKTNNFRNNRKPGLRAKKRANIRRKFAKKVGGTQNKDNRKRSKNNNQKKRKQKCESSSIRDSRSFANNMFGSVTNMQRSNNLLIDYALKRKPRVTRNYIETSHNGEISWKGTGHTPFGPSKLIDDSSGGKMFEILVSDFLVNSMLYHAYTHGMLTLRINPQSPGARKFMRTSCDDSMFCFGDFVPGLAEEYHDHGVELTMKPTGAPAMVFQETQGGRVITTLKGIIFIWVQLPGRKRHVLTIDADVRGNTHVWMVENLVKGNLTNGKFDFKVHSSRIKALDEDDKEEIEEMAADVVTSITNGLLRRGLPIPTIPLVRMVNPKIKILKRSIRIVTDFSLDKGGLKNITRKLLSEKLASFGKEIKLF